MAVNVIGTIKPWEGGEFPIVEAEDVEVAPNERLDDALRRIEHKLVIITQEEYAEGTYYAPEGAVVIVIEPDKYDLEDTLCCCGCESYYHNDANEGEAVT